MDTLSTDTLLLVVLELDLASILALSRVSRTTNNACELSWPLLYERQYNRRSLQPKLDYKHNLFSAGVVMRYCGNGPDGVQRHMKRYMKVDGHEACITLDDECMVEGKVIEVDVVDIDVSSRMLYVLTKTERAAIPLHNGKRILHDDAGFYCETYDGRFFSTEGEIPRTRLDRHYTVRVDGQCIELNFLTCDVLELKCGMDAIVKDGVYIVGSMYPERMVAIDAIQCVPCSYRDLVILTRTRRLVHYHWLDSTISTIDARVLPGSLVSCGGEIFYIRCSL
jgi:hypothetical protein